jgi:hypothetical protein
MDEGLIVAATAVALALVLATILIMSVYYRYRARADAQATIRAALEKGQPLSPELLTRLMEPLAPSANRRNLDLRRGVILVALGVGIAAIGLAAAPTWKEALAVAALPLTIGIAYVALWRFAPRA